MPKEPKGNYAKNPEGFSPSQIKAMNAQQATIKSLQSNSKSYPSTKVGTNIFGGMQKANFIKKKKVTKKVSKKTAKKCSKKK